MKKLIVVGPPAAGKSTLAFKLGDILSLPVVHLDFYFWKPGWKPTSYKNRINKINELTSKNDGWILDGNYENTIDYQLGITEGVIFLDFPPIVCSWRAIKRRLSYVGKKRPEIAPGCPDKLDWDFLSSIWLYPANEGKSLRKKLSKHQEELFVVRLQNSSEVERYLVKTKNLQNLSFRRQTNNSSFFR